MIEYIHKSHNVTVLLYHLVFPATYRRAICDSAVDSALKEVCLEIEELCQLRFLEIGKDKSHVPFLVRAIPRSSFMKKVVTIIKRLTAELPQVKKQLWGELWVQVQSWWRRAHHGLFLRS